MAQIVKRKIQTGEIRYDVRTRIGGRVVTRTFNRRKEANAYASTVEADKLRGVVVDPRRATVTLEEYAKQWLAQRPDLAIRTTELYQWLFDRHIAPRFGTTTLADISPAAVRSWHAAADLGNSPLSITEIPQLIAGVGCR